MKENVCTCFGGKFGRKRELHVIFTDVESGEVLQTCETVKTDLKLMGRVSFNNLRLKYRLI